MNEFAWPVRKAAKADLSALVACAEAAYRIYVERIGRKPAPMVADFAASIDGDSVYVVIEAGQLRGFVVCYPRDDCMFLENIAVDPKHQGQGIGSRLIAFVEAEARARKLEWVELYTNARMFENLELYSRLGFREIERRVEDGFDRVFFRKHLSV